MVSSEYVLPVDSRLVPSDDLVSNLVEVEDVLGS